MIEFFGHERDTKPSGQILTADYAALLINNSQMSLIQTCSLTYQRTVSQHFEAGSPNVYFTMGRPTGSLQGSRFVGSEVFAGLQNADTCGELAGVSLALQGDGACSAAVGQVVGLEGVYLTAVGLQFGVGALEVMDNFAMLVATVRVT